MLEKNLELLKEKFPQLFKLVTEVELPDNYESIGKSIKYCNNLLFSKYSPEKEAETLFSNFLNKNPDTSTVLIFGIANPFLIEKFIEKFKVFIFIPDLRLFKLCLNFLDYTKILKKAVLFYEPTDIQGENLIIYPLKIEEKFFGEKLNQIKNILKNSRKLSKPKILIIKPFYGGSLPVINYCEMNLKKFDVKVKAINSNEIFSAYNIISDVLQKKEFISNMRVKLVEFVSELVYYAIEEFKPDIVFAIAQSPLNDKILNYIRQKGIISIFWFVEDYKLFTYWQYFAPLYDYYFVIQKDDFFEKLNKIGVKNYHYLPLACEPTIHKPLKLSKEEKERYGSTISFVGAGYYNRRIFFQKLLNYDFKIWGSDWENEIVLQDLIQENGRRVSTEEAVKIFNSSLINLNLHSSSFYSGIAPDGDFVNPRTFEIAACRSYQLVDKRKYLPLHFDEGKDILTFSNETELKKLIDEIISDNEKYAEIKDNSYKRVISEHTYKHRLLEIAKIVGFQLKEKVEYSLNEKDFYLSKFDTLEDITDYIRKKDKVTKTDTIFLLLQELKNTYLK